MTIAAPATAEMQSILALALGLAKAMDRASNLPTMGVALQSWTGAIPESPCEIADALGRAREQALRETERVQSGAHHTPPALARKLATHTLEDRNPQRVFDPCCGAGVFLCAVAEERLRQGQAPMDGMIGWDRDPLAVYTTELVLAIAFGPQASGAVLRCCDATTEVWPEVDLVITNPPFVSSGLSKGGLDAATRARLRERFPIGFQRRSDLAAAFVEAAVRATVPGGRVSLVLPESLLATQAAQPLREWLTREAPPSHIDLLGADVFPDANVRAATWQLERGAALSKLQLTSRSPWNEQTVAGAELADAPWSAVVVSPQQVPPLEIPPETVPLTALAELSRGFTDDFYFLARSIHEAGTHPPDHPVLSVGLVDPGRHWWGARRAKIAGQWFERPALHAEQLHAEDSKRATRLLSKQRGRRLLLATRSAVLECCSVPDGVIAQVPLITLQTEDPETLDLVYAQLLSPFATAWYLSRYGHLDQTGAGVDLRVPALGEFPLLPITQLSGVDRLQLRACLLALDEHPGRAQLQAVQRFALHLMGQRDEELMAWWWQRLPKKLSAGYNL